MVMGDSMPRCSAWDLVRVLLVISVETVPIDVRIPIDRVCVVAMQPFVRFRAPLAEPFQWADDAVDAQLIGVARTLQLARDGIAGRPATFTLFPEYSLPGLRGARVVDDEVRSTGWQNDTVVVAGVHGISRHDYGDLCDALSITFVAGNGPAAIPAGQWVNCCLTWVRDSHGTVRCWVQPKIRPAWAETAVPCQDMFHGSAVHVFRCAYDNGYPCHFVTLICYDWVARDGVLTVCEELLSQLNTEWVGAPQPLHWMFVLQHNDKPNASDFLNSTDSFLTDVTAHPFVERANAAVLHVNTAALDRPLRKGPGGFTACVLSPSAQVMSEGCRPSVRTKPESLRGSDILRRCKDTVFREMGECIHVFTVRVARFITPTAGDKTYGVPEAYVYALGDSLDPRLCGGAVPAAVKWINDVLDDTRQFSATALAGHPLAAVASLVEPIIIEGLRHSDGQRGQLSIDWATCRDSSAEQSASDRRRSNADLWDDTEVRALSHVLHSLTPLSVAYELVPGGARLHGAILTDRGFVDVVAVSGDTYEDCCRHYGQHVAPFRGSDPVLVIARDRDNLDPLAGELTRVDDPASRSGEAFLDYHTLVTKCREATDQASLKGRLDGFLPGERRII